MSAATQPKEYAETVRGQYEDYPYPLRDPEKEGENFYWCDATSIVGLSHYGWEGRRDFRQGPTRILSAGCGTGDVAIMYAEDLMDCDAEIIAIDLSEKSLDIAQKRLKKRGLSNVQFRHMSILDLPKAGLGKFDIIESSGVLHHLPDPNEGLAALSQLLKDDGMISGMVYGQYGRLSVYLVQELMRNLMTENTPREEKIAIAREFLNHVPVGHWLTFNNEMFKADISWPDGSGIYDLFLHSHDRAYTVPQLYEWVEGCGLVLNELYETMVSESMYEPETYNISPRMLAIYAKKSTRERQTIAELLNGNMAKHSFNASKQPKRKAQFADDMVVCFGPMQALFLPYVKEYAKYCQSLPINHRVDGKITSFTGQPNLTVVTTKHTAALMNAIDDQRSIGEIVAAVAKETHSPAEEVRRNFEQLYRELRTRQVVFLRHESIPPYRSGPEIISRLEKLLGKKLA